MQLREDFAEQQVKFINEALTIKGFDHKHIVKVDSQNHHNQNQNCNK
jgi:hypothetical protein